MTTERSARSISIILPVSSTYHATSLIRDIAHGLDNIGIDLSKITIAVPIDILADLRIPPTKDGVYEWPVDGAIIKLSPQENSK